MKELIRVEIPNYIEYVKLSNKRKPKYYASTDVIPTKFEKNFDAFGYLIGNDGCRIIKNSRSVDKPRLIKISGQDLWTGINFSIRKKISSELKSYFYEYFRGIEPIKIEDYPLGVEIQFHDSKMTGDLDNLETIYRKVIHDALCGNVSYKKEGKAYVADHQEHPPIIIDDSKPFIQELKTSWILCEEDKRKMVIKIYSL